MNRQQILEAARAECLRAFARHTPGLAKQAADALFALAGQPQDYGRQRLLLDASGTLQRRGPAFSRWLEQGFAELTARALTTAYSRERPDATHTAGAQALSLVEAAVIDDEIRLGRVTGRFHEHSGARIQELNLRIATLFRQEEVRERENPFRPYLFSRCVTSAVAELDLAPEASQLATEQVVAALLPGVDSIYAALNAFFEEAGVAPRLQAGGSTAKNPGNGDAARGLTADRSTAVPASRKVDQLLRLVRRAAPLATLPGGWPQDTQAIGRALKSLLKPAATAAQADGGLPSLGAATAGRAIEPPSDSVYYALQDSQATALQDVLDAQGEVRNLIFEKRSSLAGKARNGHEMMTIDVVGMIFEFILRDPEVPAEVRAQLGRLQFLILKIALVDSRFLGDSAHPARLLLNRIGTVAQGVKRDDRLSARLTGEIHRIVEALLADTSVGMELVSRLQAEFEDFVCRQLHEADEAIERAAAAVELAEQRSFQLAGMSVQLRQALAAAEVDGPLRKFLEQTWLRAIEQAEQSGQCDLADRYRALVPELVWSVQDKTTDGERAQLVALLPKMIGDLQAGMKLVVAEATSGQAFLGWLIERHTGAVRASKAAGAIPAESLADVRERFAGFAGGGEPVDEEVTAFRFEPGFIEEALADARLRLLGDDPIAPVAPIAPIAPVAPAGDDAGPGDGSVFDRLSIGVPVEIDFDGTPQRALLTWVSKRATSMLLAMDGSKVPTMITVTLFCRLLANGRARFMESAPLFERAIGALLASAERVDEALAQ